MNTIMMKKIIPIILSGGSGSRLWPVSREVSPKPFIVLGDGMSLLQKAVDRAVSLPDVSEIIVVTREELYWRTQEQVGVCETHGVHVDYLLEPVGRNTGSAISVAILFVKEKYGNDVSVLILSADHLIDDTTSFVDDVADACELAQRGYLVTFGIFPSSPNTGYGYIEKGLRVKGTSGFRVARFVEKPNVDHAEELISNGNVFWNSGIFCFAVSVFLREASIHTSEMLMGATQCIENVDCSLSKISFAQEQFAKLPNISIDHALMEHSLCVAVIPAHFDWKDVGSWNTMAELFSGKDGENQMNEHVFSLDTKNSYIHPTHRFVATIGIEDLVIVDTPDALLVAHKEKTQEVKKVTDHLKTISHESYLLHRTVYRPWGTYTIIEEGEGFKVKRITVKPGAKLSLQSHIHRSEHWVVVRGVAIVTNGDEEITLHPNESAFVRAGNKHRLANPHESNELEIIETQVGSYLGEDDIKRYDDQYQRV